MNHQRLCNINFFGKFPYNYIPLVSKRGLPLFAATFPFACIILISSVLSPFLARFLRQSRNVENRRNGKRQCGFLCCAYYVQSLFFPRCGEGLENAGKQSHEMAAWQTETDSENWGEWRRRRVIWEEKWRKKIPRPLPGRNSGRVGEMLGCWTEMAGSLTGGKILDLLKNFYLMPSSLNFFRNFGCFIYLHFLTNV